MVAIKLTQVDNSVGAVFPKEVLHELSVQKGDTLYLTRGPDGAMRLSAYNEKVAGQIDAAREVMSQYRDTLRALAKSRCRTGSKSTPCWRFTKRPWPSTAVQAA